MAMELEERSKWQQQQHGPKQVTSEATSTLDVLFVDVGAAR